MSPAPTIAMYFAGLAVTFAGLHAANIALADPSFGSLTFGLTVIGFLASFISRRQNIAPRNVELPAIAVCIAVILMAVVVDPANSFLAPATVSEDRSSALALLLTWLIVFRSFTLTSDAALLFSCVPTIALIGLVSTATSDPQLLPVFIVFVTATIFMMVHENARQTSCTGTDSHNTRSSASRSVAWTGQLQASAVCTLLAIVLANVVSPVFEASGAFLRVNSGLTTIQAAQDRARPNRRFNDTTTEIQVGTGPVALSNEIIMTVRSAEPANWRGRSYDTYNGRGWNNLFTSRSQEMTRVFNNAPTDAARPDLNTFVAPPTEVAIRAERSHSLEQTVQFVQGAHTQIYGAGEPEKVTIQARTVLWDDAKSLSLVEPVTNGEYTIQSQVPEITQRARISPPGGYPAEVGGERFTSTSGIRPSARDRIRNQAREVAAPHLSAYDKVNALMQWVGERCKYNTSAKSFPADRDVVDYFLFEAKEGYCDSFATSLAILCRSIGIPARVASGYLSGDLDTSQNIYIVRDKHRHLWTEVFFNEVGWVVFDATSIAEDISPVEAVQKKSRASFLSTLLRYGWWPPLLLGVVALMLLYVLKVEVIDRFWGPKRRINGLDLPETNTMVVMEYVRACQALARKGLRLKPNETANEYFNRIENALVTCPRASAAFAEMTDLVVRCRYGATVASSEDVAQAQQCFGSLNMALRAAPRRGLVDTTSAPEAA